jgi:hypothetical protein
VADVDPRAEADGQIARAREVAMGACDADGSATRDYTPEELDVLFFSLMRAMTMLSKLPGGREARERMYLDLKAELVRRGRSDLLASVESP